MQRRIVSELPLTIGQRMLLACETQPEVTDDARLSPILQFGYKVSPSIDLKKLERALERLIRRHDSLRMSFERRGSSWRALVWDRKQVLIEVHDCAWMGPDERQALFVSIVRRTMDLGKDDLCQIVVLRGFDGADVLLFRVHHILVDGHSMLMLAEELLKLMIGLPLLGPALSHETYLREHETLSASQQRANEEYWQDLLFPVLPSPGTSAFSTGVATPIRIYSAERFVSLSRDFDRGRYEALPSALGQEGMTSFGIAMASFAEALLELSGLPGVYLITYVDRTSSALKNYAGNAVQLVPVRCERLADEPPAGFAARIAAQLRRSIAHLPSEAGFPLLRHDRQVRDAGGALCHIHCGEIFQSSRARSSSFGTGMETPIGEARKIGPLTVTQMDIPQESYSPNGLNLRIRRDSSRVRLELSFHSDLFPQANIEKLFELLVYKLGLQH